MPTTASGSAPSYNVPVAPRRHSVTLIAIFVALAAAGALFSHRSAVSSGPITHPDVLPVFGSLLALEWGLFAFVRRGLGQTGTSLRDLIGGPWASARDLLVDVVLALAMWGTWLLFLEGWRRVAGSGHPSTIAGYLPQGVVQSA